MSLCTFWSGSILATSSIAVLHVGQSTASFRVVSDTTNLNSSTTIKTARERFLFMAKSLVTAKSLALSSSDGRGPQKQSPADCGVLPLRTAGRSGGRKLSERAL